MLINQQLPTDRHPILQPLIYQSLSSVVKSGGGGGGGSNQRMGSWCYSILPCNHLQQVLELL